MQQAGSTSETSFPNSGRQKISYEITRNGIALITLGTKDDVIVKLEMERMNALRDCIKRVEKEKPKGLIIASARPDMFTAGADINLIAALTDASEAESLSKLGQEIFNELQNLSCPTVAAISGPCVGGGCELVLACRYRIISDDKSSAIGLPETRLGIIPGFGGTQRLPRLVGLPKALDIILAGKILKPSRALKDLLVDKVVPFEKLVSTAEDVVLGKISLKRKQPALIDRFLTWTSAGRKIVAKKAKVTIAKRTKGFYPAPPAALEASLLGLSEGLQKGLKFEAQELGRLVVTPECKSLVKIFFLTEESRGIGRAARKSIQHLHALIVGAGVMGAGIAASLARSGANVILKDTSHEAVNKGMALIKKDISAIRAMEEAEKSFILNRIQTTTGESSDIGNTGFVIEAVFEDLAVKRKVLQEAAELVSQDAILASNTSSLSITELSSGIPHPERVVGLHFFNPVAKMPLVEIVRGKKTSDRTVAIAAALTDKLGKYPIVVSDGAGFLINRILSPYLNEALFLISQGYGIEEIDRAATNFGMPMGPLRLLDEIGLDVATKVSEVMAAAYGERMQAPPISKSLIEAGRKGKKSGAGFYNFKDGEESPHEGIKDLIDVKSTKDSGNSELISERLILSLINEAIRCLDEGVAGAPGKEAARQIDLGTVMGIGFPPFRGGLINYAETLGAKDVFKKLDSLQKAHGMRFRPADGIARRAVDGKGFYEN